MESEDRKPIFTKRLILIILAVILLILIIFLLLRKCGPGNGGSGNSVTYVQLSPTELSLKVGEKYPVSSYVSPEDATDKQLFWTSSDDTIATVDVTGMVTAVGEGVASITATTNSGVSGQVLVTVGSALPALERIELNETTYSVKVGKTVLVVVSPYPTTAQIEDIQYRIDDESIATVGLDGTIKGLKKGTTKLLVSANNGSVYTTATVKVTSGGSGSGTPSTGTPDKNIPVSSIELPTPRCYRLKVGSTYSLTATVLPSNATNKTLSYTSSKSNFATVSNDGKVTAKSAGTTMITVEAASGVYSTFEIQVVSKSSNQKEGSCSTTVNPGDGNQYTPPSGGSSSSGGNSSSGGSNNSGNSDVVTSTAATKPTNETYNIAGQTYNVSINSYIETKSLAGTGKTKYVKEARCIITLSGTLPPYYKAEVTGYNGEKTEFRDKIAIDVKGNKGVNVGLYVYKSDTTLAKYEEYENICGKLKDGTQIIVDNEKPITCELSLATSATGTPTITLTASDNEGGSGLSKVVWNNNIPAHNFSGTETGTTIEPTEDGEYIATVYDKAGNSKSCGINVTNDGTQGTQISPTESSKIESISIVSSTTVFSKAASSKTTSLGIKAKFEDGSSQIFTYDQLIGGNVQIPHFDTSITAGTQILVNNNTNYTNFISVSGSNITFHNSLEKGDYTLEVRFTSPNGTVYSASKTFKIIDSDITCSLVGEKAAGTYGKDWYRNVGVKCTTEKSTPISVKIKYSTLELSEMTTSKVTQGTYNDKKTYTAMATGLNGKAGVANLTYSYQVNGTTFEETYYDLKIDDKLPTCNAYIDGRMFTYMIEDGLYSSGVKLDSVFKTGEDLGTGGPISYAYEANKKPTTNDKVYDNTHANNKISCNVSAITDAAINNMPSAATMADKIVITREDRNSEELVYNSVSQRYEISPTNSRTYIISTYDDNGNLIDPPPVSGTTTSILGALKKLDSTSPYTMTVSNPGVIKVLSADGNRVQTRFVGIGKAYLTVCVKGTNVCDSESLEIADLNIKPTKILIGNDTTMALNSAEELSLTYFPYSTNQKAVTITSSNSNVVKVDNSKLVAVGTGTATINVISLVDSSVRASVTITVSAKDTTKPTVTITERNVNSTIHVNFTAKDENQLTLKYGIVKGGTCIPDTLSTRVAEQVTETRILTSKGTYTACIEAEDSSGNKATYTKTIEASGLNESGKISCTVSGTTDGTIRVGSSKLATITCTSDEKINVNSLNFVNSSNVSVTATKNEVSGDNYYRVVINVTTKGVKEGAATVALAAGSLSTSTNSNSQIHVGGYGVIAASAPTTKSSCAITYDSSSKKLTASVTAENVQSMEYDTYNWTSIGGNKYQKTIDPTKTQNYTFSAKIYYKDGRASETISCSRNYTGSTGTDTPLQAPSISYVCAGSPYTEGKWCNNNIDTNIIPPTTGATMKRCRVSGAGKCNPFTGDYSIITSSGTYTVCAGYIKNGKNSLTSCKTISAKIDKTAPTCDITMEAFSSGTTVTLTAKVTEKESGLASAWTTGWKDQAEGSYTISKNIPAEGQTETITFTVKDKVGNQGTCKIQITSKKECKSGYHEISGGTWGYCYQYEGTPDAMGDWKNVDGSYSPSKGSKTPTRANASSTTTTAYEYYQAAVSKCAQYGPYITECWEERIYKRYADSCKSGTHKFNNQCYWRTAKILVPKVVD